MKLSKLTVPFAQIPNSVLFSTHLSWKAKGIWAYMQAKPDKWNFSSKRMSEEATDGIDSTLSGINELIACGYLIAQKLPSGRVKYKMSQKAKTGISHSGKIPLRENPVHDKERETINKEQGEIYLFPDGNDHKTKKKIYENTTPQSLDEFLVSMKKSKLRHIQIIGEWAEGEKPDCRTVGQWQEFIDRNCRPAAELIAYSTEQLEKAYHKMLKNVPHVNPKTGKTEGFLTKYTLETLRKYL